MNLNLHVKYMICRAIQENLPRLDWYEDRTINPNITDVLFMWAELFWELIDDYSAAKAINDVDEMYRIITVISENEILKMLSIYHLDLGR